MQTITNKRTRYEYEILDTFEAGVELRGNEVKAIKSGRINLAGSYVAPRDGEMFLLGADIPPYQPKNTPADYDPLRQRRLLLTATEIKEIVGKLSAGGLTMIPLKVYTKNSLVKFEIALAKPKKKHDKRDAIKKRHADREIERTLKNKR